MDEAFVFSIALFGLVAACVAEHLIRPTLFERTTRWQRTKLIALRILMAALLFIVMISVPQCSQNSECKIDLEGPLDFDACE